MPPPFDHSDGSGNQRWVADRFSDVVRRIDGIERRLQEAEDKIDSLLLASKILEDRKKRAEDERLQRRQRRNALFQAAAFVLTVFSIASGIYSVVNSSFFSNITGFSSR